jgi:predicted lipoprotein with Yx(FWY)xxD motif
MQGPMVRYVALAAFAFVTLAACSSSSKPAATPTTPAPTSAAATTAPTPTSAGTTSAKTTVAVATTKLGKVLVDSTGMTLYTSAGDTTPGASSCTGACATIWPPLAATAAPTYAAGLTASKFTTITRSDATLQLSYNGKPLYTFASDKAPGDTTGQGVGGFTVATSS